MVIPDSSLIINVSNITYETDINIIRKKDEFSLNYEDLALYSDLKIRGVIDKVSNNFLFTGKIKTGLHVTCSLCLEKFVMSISSDLRLVYKTYVEPNPGEEIELTNSELDTYFFMDNIIDLNDAVRDQLIILLPINRRCSNACKGLCSICGANLNLESCLCKKEIDESPFSILNKLKYK